METGYKLNTKQEKYLSVKYTLDFIFGIISGILLLPVMTVIAMAIYFDSPGPILFKQKRAGKNKNPFFIWKFRTMKADTPKDVPTHLLKNPEQYITKVGRFLRRTSLDELPQIYQLVLNGRPISICGPRPALWNQSDLIRERDKYGANSIKPGITGWAQINGRDVLEIDAKARLDGEYIKKIGLWMDIKCFFGTVIRVLSGEGVIEGGTGELNRKCTKDNNMFCDIDDNHTELDAVQKKILITGADSYIGVSVKNWLSKYPSLYVVDTLDMHNNSWKDKDFSAYDVIYHVAGIAHADGGSVTNEQKQLYYNVNTRLAVQTAGKAKKAGVKQFIFMSSMIIYSGCEENIIRKDTQPKPLNFYGNSKWQADKKIQTLSSENFKVVILRPPMIYGKGSKGNYPKLAKLASKLPVFPIVKNKRSILYIDNLCEFVKKMIDNEEAGIFFPQNLEYMSTSYLTKIIADIKGHKIIMLPGTEWAVKAMMNIPGKIGNLCLKAFDDFAYEMEMSEYKDNYRVCTLHESIEITESKSD